MRFATLRDFRTKGSALLAKAGEDETIVVTLRGRPVALFVPVDEERLEEMNQAIKAARLRASWARLQEAAHKAGSDRLSPAAIDREIRAARRARRA